MNAKVEPKEHIPDPSIYPGLSLSDILQARGISQADLARRMNKPVQAINEIIMGKKEIIPDTAIALEHVLGIAASFWLKLESNHRESLARHKEDQELNQQIELAKLYPYKEMIKFGWVKPANNKKEMVSELLKWLGVANLNLISSQYEVAFRKSEKFSLSKEKLAAWLRHGEIELQNRELGVFDKNRLADLMLELRSMTTKAIQDSSTEAQNLCSKYGIALIFTPEFKSFPVSGATRWISGKPVVQVSLRFKTDDHLWFSIFHEIGHVFQHRKDLFLENSGKEKNRDQEEKEANQFAADYLIPSEAYKKFIEETKFFDESSVRKFASSVGIAPGIVVGRLQHEGKIPMNHLHRLKMHLQWGSEE